MAATIWKGHITFGLVSIPVKLLRAGRAEKVSFRQIHAASGSRVRQTYMAPSAAAPEPETRGRVPEPAPELPPARSAPQPISVRSSGPERSLRAVPAAAPPAPAPEAEEREITRNDMVKGYEYAKDRYVTLTREDLEKITPRTARDMQILEFVELSHVDPIYYETSYYVAPDKGGERAYALLFEALRRSGYVGVAQIAMHNREHIALIRPGRTGIVLHTMFYENEVHQEDEYRTDTSGVVDKEMDLAMMLVRNLAAPFEPGKYRDTYREKLDELIRQKLEGQETLEAPEPKPAAVVNILEALQRSLQQSAARKPPATAEPEPRTPARTPRKRAR